MFFNWVPVPPGSDDFDRTHDVRHEIVLDPDADQETLVAVIETMTLDQIGVAWRATDRLLTTSVPPAADKLVRLRGLLLDELEVRHPWAYRRWLRQRGPRLRR